MGFFEFYNRLYYKRYKGGTPRKRNDEMVDICDMVLSFWDGISKGTKHILIMQRKLGSK